MTNGGSRYPQVPPCTLDRGSAVSRTWIDFQQFGVLVVIRDKLAVGLRAASDVVDHGRDAWHAILAASDAGDWPQGSHDPSSHLCRGLIDGDPPPLNLGDPRVQPKQQASQAHWAPDRVAPTIVSTASHRIPVASDEKGEVRMQQLCVCASLR